jgi:hypothetical protein
MSSPGNLSEQSAETNEQPQGQNPRFWPITLAALLVIVALWIGSQFIGVLYAMIFPPQPPRPGNITQLEHVNDAYGVDEWLYASSEDACEITRYYQQTGADCTASPGFCSSVIEGRTIPSRGTNVAQCQGAISFSIFAMEWHANIAAGYEEETPSRLRLSREVYWTGTVPRATPRPEG